MEAPNEPLDAPEKKQQGYSNGYKTMLRIENIAVGFVMIAMLFRFMIWPYASVVNIIAWGALSAVYLIGWQLLIQRSDMGDDSVSLLLMRFTAIVLAVAYVGILFNLFWYPGAGIILSGAAAAGLLVLLPVLGSKLTGATFIHPRAAKWIQRRLLPLMLFVAITVYLRFAIYG